MSAVKAHDFHRTETLDRQYLPSLSAAFDACARRISVELSASLRRAAQAAFASLREMSWRELTAMLGERPYLMSFNLDPLSGTAFLSLSLGTVVRMIELRLGGTQPPFATHTELTDTDFAVLAGVLRPLLVAFADSLSRVREVSAQPVAQESSVQFAQHAGPNEMFLVAAFDLAMGEEAAEMVVALPFPLVRQFTEAVRSGARTPDDGASRVDREVVMQADLDLWLEIPSVRLSFDEVSELKPGDVIRFFHPLRRPLDLRAEGVLVAKASPGALGSKCVCSILEEVSSDES